MTMTKQTMIRNYRKFSAADGYILGFPYKGEVYMVTVEEIMPRFLTVEVASRNQGDNLRLRLRKAHIESFMKKIPYTCVLYATLKMANGIKAKCLKNMLLNISVKSGKKI